MRGLKDRVVLVTGGAGGIGAAICRRMAGEGAVVAVCDLDGAAAGAVAAGIGEAGGRARAWRLDITDQAAVVAAVADIEAALGAIDVLVNNAGWDRAIDFLDSDKALWEKVVAVNLWGHLHMHHAVLTGMKARGRGRVVNIASDAARVGSSGESVYS
ncbi:MAG: SDR family NAD(P)-dependent oxidoreductase, partial [Rhodocyclaceae bacterium]|nr:SDR family NAD(P)-dependent oxidoreductase [Rhodocyclaceae bacterium]